MRKIILLNSGGFDSIVLGNTLTTSLDDVEITSLFFNYGQKNLELERECSRKFADKHKLKHYEMDISIPWTKSSMCGNDTGDKFVEYVELRNVIFLSYAMSLAESIGADEIYSALIANGTYADTTEKFVEDTKKYMENFNISFETPFINCEKMFLGHLARAYNIQRGDFFSCNNPSLNKPCGECNDCKIINNIYEEIMPNNSPIKEWGSNDGKITPKFKELFMKSLIKEVRLLINNKCQFRCSHCFYGFDETVSEELSKEEMYKVIDEIASIPGIENIHFSGKEPLINEDIFDYAKYIKDNAPHLTYDVVTNGVNVIKYIDKLKDLNFKKVYLSVDSLTGDNYIRPTNKHILETVNALVDKKIDIEVFIDIHNKNLDDILPTIVFLYELGVNDFYVRTVCPIGNGKKLNSIVTIDELAKLYDNIRNMPYIKDLNIKFYLHSGFTKSLLDNVSSENLSQLYVDVLDSIELASEVITRNLNLHAELFCSAGESQITVTSDGYVLGCATEVSSKVYHKIASGNVLNKPLQSLIEKRKKFTIDLLKKQGDTIKPCYHSFYSIK